MTEMIRVCVISDGCSEFIVPAAEWVDHIAEINDCEDEEEYQYTLTFKNMPRSEVESLPEFDGF